MTPKYAVSLTAVGSNVPVEKILDTLPNGEDGTVWADEYTVSKGETGDGTPRITAHVPLHEEADATDVFDNLRGLNGVLNSADSGHLHVHECPTGGGPDAWNCDERIIEEIVVE